MKLQMKKGKEKCLYLLRKIVTCWVLSNKADFTYSTSI